MGRQAFNFEWLVLIPAILLTCLGLATLLSVDTRLFYQQLIFVLLGILAFWFFSRMDFGIYTYIYKFLYGGSLLFLLLSFLGPSVRGATRWLEIGTLRLQPSELVKPFFLLSVSSFMARYPTTTPKSIAYHLGFFLLPFLLIFIQPDLGNALIYTSSWMSMLIVSGIRTLALVIGVIGLVTIMPFGFNLLRDYQRMRILTFLNPLIDPRGGGYNAIQSMIAVGSGRIFGRGFGRGTQSILNFLPERHTDFIFATLTEEFGFIGGLVLLVIFFILLWQVLNKSKKLVNQPMASYYGTGFFMLLFTHIVINVGMNMGVVPITGITLPLVSYGGSSMLSTWIGLGIFMSAIQNNRRNI